MPIAHILKIDGDKIRRINAGLHQLRLHQFQHHGLAASANAGHDLDQLAADERPNPAHVLFSFDHGNHSLWLSDFSISQLKLKFNAKYVKLWSITDNILVSKKVKSYIINSGATGQSEHERSYVLIRLYMTWYNSDIWMGQCLYLPRNRILYSAFRIEMSMSLLES